MAEAKNVPELLHEIAGGDIKWQLLLKMVWKFLKKLKMELPYDSIIPVLGIYQKELNAEM